MARQYQQPKIQWLKEILVGIAWGVGFAIGSELLALAKTWYTGKPQPAVAVLYAS